jgi:YHS domain-containing protein
MSLFRKARALVPGIVIAWGLCSSLVYAEALTRVEAIRICMMNNAAFPNDQIPTIVEGKTYYGCCPMCAEKLKSDPALRRAVDPVSGKEVDKALAIVGVDSKGKAYYFENENNLKKFSS